jgi:hypothetical protein
VNEFDEAAIGKLANDVHGVLRDLKRSMRDRMGEVPPACYTPEQARAAQATVTALAEVDRTFAAYRPTEPMQYCDCCTDPALIARLVSQPLDELSEDDVAEVAASLLYTIGGEDDLKYFVPRFCRDVLTAPLYDINSVFARFVRAGFDAWPEAERRAVRTFLRAAWKNALLTSPRRDLSSLSDNWLEVLDSMASLGFIEDALTMWDDEHGNAADARLLELVSRLETGDDSVRVVGTGGFCDNGAAYDVLERWLRLASVRARIDAVLASSRAADSSSADVVDEVLNALDARPPR